jgi:hypothetical protein
MPTLSRKVILPVVCGVLIILLSVAGYTSAVLPWFLDYYDYLQGQTRNSIDYGTVVKAYHDYHWIGVPLELCSIGFGVQLLKRAEQRANHVVWYAMLSMSLSVFWLVWTLCAERSLYVLLLPA